MNFVFVHGIQQGQESSEKLKDIWLGALKPRELTSVSVPFYGGKLDDFVEGHRGPASTIDYTEFAAEFKAEISGMPVAEILESDLLAKRGKGHRGLQNLWLTRALGLLADENVPFLADIFFNQWMKEVHTYLNNIEAKAVVDEIVDKEITEMCKKGPTVVVGHSLGSVVAYNVLRARKFDHVRHFVSLGSPLGVSAVTRRLPVYADGRLLRLDEWLNGFDHRDIVALRPLSREGLGSTCSIENKDDLENTTENRHGIIGYLRINSVASYLVEKLGALQ